VALWLLFGLVTWILAGSGRGDNVAKAFLGGALPLTAGVLAAFALLDDPALELQFSTPAPPWKVILERMGLILAVTAAAALSFQVLLGMIHIDLSDLGPLLVRQAAWFTPSLAMISLGCLAALALVQPAFGAVLAGGVWTFQLLQQYFFIHNPVARCLFLFMGISAAGHPDQGKNVLCLASLSLLCLLASIRLYREQERYL
jgi:hypothetical protein